MKTGKLINKVKSLAKREVASDDESFNPADYSGHNFDDCYIIGATDGFTLLAKELLEILIDEGLCDDEN